MEITIKNDKETKLPKKDAFKQILACCIANLLVIQPGINMSFSAILLPQLKESNSNIIIDNAQASWIASIVAIALPLGSLCTGAIMDKFGRKTTCIFSTIPFLFSWGLHYFANNIWYIYIARILAGFGAGLTTVCVVYTSEIAHPKYRPILLLLNSVYVTFGILLTCILGFWFHWRIISIIYFGLVLFSLLILFWIPESPYWLAIFKNNNFGAARVLNWMYSDKILAEEIYHNVLECRNNESLKFSINLNNLGEKSKLIEIKETMNLYKQPIVWKPFLILFFLFVFQQFSGAYVIIFYAVDIFRKISGKSNNNINNLDGFGTLILLGSIRFIISLISTFISNIVGRRKLMFTSIIGMIFTSFFCGFYMYFFQNFNLEEHHQIDGLENNNNTQFNNNESIQIMNNSNIPIGLVLGYVSFSSFGVLVLPWALIAELLPIKVRGKLGGILVSIAYLLMFFVVKIFPFLLESTSLDHIFIVVGLINTISLGFTYLWLPETLQKSFEEISHNFEKTTSVEETKL